MIEAQIECLCPHIDIPDINLALDKGAVVWLPEARARGSSDLMFALQIKAVSVRWRERCQVAQSPTPPFLKRSISKPQRTAPSVDVSAVARQAEAAATTAVAAHMDTLQAMIAAEIQKHLAPLAGQMVTPDLRSEVERAVTRALGAGGSTPQRVSSDGVDSSEPIFIPSQIVSDNTKADIAVKSESSVSGEVAGASAALRTARRGRPPKIKPDQE